MSARERITASCLSILKRAAANPKGARLKGRGQQASGRHLDRQGLGRFVGATPDVKARFYINDAGRRELGEDAPDERYGLIWRHGRGGPSLKLEAVQAMGAPRPVANVERAAQALETAATFGEDCAKDRARGALPEPDIDEGDEA